MNSGVSGLDLHFVCEGARMPPPPEMGPEGYARLIESVWALRSEAEVQRYLNDEQSRPVNAWFRLDGSTRTDR